jgi:DHA1 family bicyclomycin/chloramphenicol resistance-like MFS transporter
MFIAFVAGCMSMVAMSIDTILPAFDDIREAFGLTPESNAVTWVITGYFLGLAAGQLFYGALSDRFGRKPLLFTGLVIYVVGSLGSTLAPSLPLLVAARVLWGLGAAGPRSLAIAMVRDRVAGDAMARTMSFVMTLFIVVPVFAPAVGAAAIAVSGSWHAAFLLPGVGAVVLAVWAVRMPETLPVDRRRAVSPRALAQAATAVVRCRQAALLCLAIAFLFGGMASYLASSELVIDEAFGCKDQFPVIFGVIAAVMGLGSFTNSRLVTAVGTRRLLYVSSSVMVVLSALLTVLSRATDGVPPFGLFVVLMGVLLASIGLTLPNANAAAMEPLGHVAGMAASILGVVMTAGGAVIGAVLDRFADGTVTPLATGLLASTAVAASLVVLALRSPAPAVAPSVVPAPADH